MNRDPKRPVTLDDLLQLKRAERPAAEFWSGFERDLRAKQLAALVEKRPWWRMMPRVFAGFSRYHLPIGAVAILALTFVSIREYRAGSSTAPVASIKAAPVAAVAPAVGAVAVALRAESAVAQNSGLGVPLREPALASSGDGPASVGPDRVVPVVAILGVSAADRIPPSARTIALNRVTAQTLDPELSNRFLATAHGFEARALPARQPAVEPLSQVSVSEARRSRQLAFALPAAYTSSPASSEKIARKISDDRLYDSVSRFGAHGNSLNVKF